jgi:hypothetical protein
MKSLRLLIYGFVFLVVAGVLATGTIAIASDVSDAQFAGTIRVTNNGTSTTGVSCNVSIGTQGLINGNDMNTSANNTCIRTNGGADTAFYPAHSGNTSWMFWVPTIGLYGNLDYTFYTGGTTDMASKLRWFPGDAGASTNDVAGMEPADNFTLQLTGYIDTSVSDNILRKDDALNVFTGSGNVTVKMWSDYSGNFTPDAFLDPGVSWGDETLAYDNSVATAASGTTAGPGWSDYITFILPSVRHISGMEIYKNNDGVTDNISADVWTDGAWVEVVPSQDTAELSWVSHSFNDVYLTDRIRVRLYGDTTAIISEIKMLAGVSISAAVANGEHTVDVGSDGVFKGLGIDASPFELCVTDNLVLNAILGQSESDNATFTSIDSNQYSINVTQAIWTLNEGYYFDGADDYLQVEHDAAQLLTTGGTIEAWIKPDTGGEGSQGRIVDKSTGLSGNNGFRFFTGGTNVQFSINAGTTRASGANSVMAGDGNWYHVAVTWDAISNVTIYVNGVLSGTPGTTNAAAGITTGNAIRIGNRSGATDRTYDGDIGEVRIYNVELTATEILRNYNATKSKYTTGDIYQYSSLLSIPDNANDWYVGGSSTPYIEQYTHTVGGSLIQSLNCTVWPFNGTDNSGNSNDATPTYRISSSDADVSAELITWNPLNLAYTSNWTLGVSSTMVNTTPTTPTGMYGTANGTGFFGGPIFDVLIPDTSTKNMFLYTGATLIVVLFGLATLYFSRSLMAQTIVMAVVMGVLSFTVLPFWTLLVFIIYAATINVSARQFGSF